MADDASRLFHLSDSALLTHFNTVYPQTNSWRIVHPTSKMLSSVISARLAQEAGRSGIVSTRANSNDKTWLIWAKFCTDLDVDPSWLSNVGIPILLLQVFGQQYRTGHLAPSHQPVKSRTVEGALRTVGQTFVSVGSPDPWLTGSSGKHEFRIRRQLTTGYVKADPPPNRVKPIPTTVIYHLITQANAQASIDSLASADMVSIAFFFLMCPGEYTAPTGENTPFTLVDIQFYVGVCRVSASVVTGKDLFHASFVTYTLTTQKNCVRNKVIGLGRSGNPVGCPVSATARRIQHLRDNLAPPPAPLCTYYLDGSPSYVTANDITSTLQASVAALGPQLGFLATDVSDRSLHAAGVMALLCAHVDTNTIRLLGRCHSVIMLRYLTVHAQPVMGDFSHFPNKTPKRRQTLFYLLYFPAFDPLWLSRPPSMFVRLLHILPK